jgi:hypothetical protein
MLTRNYDRVQRYFPMRAIGLAVAERGLRAYFGLCPDGMVTKAGILKNPFQGSLQIHRLASRSSTLV